MSKLLSVSLSRDMGKDELVQRRQAHPSSAEPPTNARFGPFQL